jgi:hypothetical protein
MSSPPRRKRSYHTSTPEGNFIATILPVELRQHGREVVHLVVVNGEIHFIFQQYKQLLGISSGCGTFKGKDKNIPMVKLLLPLAMKEDMKVGRLQHVVPASFLDNTTTHITSERHHANHRTPINWEHRDTFQTKFRAFLSTCTLDGHRIIPHYDAYEQLQLQSLKTMACAKQLVALLQTLPPLPPPPPEEEVKVESSGTVTEDELPLIEVTTRSSHRHKRIAISPPPSTQTSNKRQRS